MGFTVIRPDGITDAAFQPYARQLRQQGADLGRLRRVPEPETHRRWLPVWNTREEADTFADELRQRTGDDTWTVVEVNGGASEGPLSPLLIQFSRQGDGLTLGVHPLSKALLRSSFPDALGLISHAFIRADHWAEFSRRGGGLAEWVRLTLPVLTGLSREQLEELGYAVIDSDDERTVVFVPPPMPATV